MVCLSQVAWYSLHLALHPEPICLGPVHPHKPVLHHGKAVIHKHLTCMPPGWILGEAPGHTGEIISLRWPGNTSAFAWIRWRRLGGRRSGVLCLGCCPVEDWWEMQLLEGCYIITMLNWYYQKVTELPLKNNNKTKTFISLWNKGVVWWN